MAYIVTPIPASLNRFTSTPVFSTAKRKVAGYARVSTDLEEQQTSYEAQMDYYKDYITSRDDWEFVGMYSDEGITATNTRHRDGFNKMIADALAGRIDLIITKSISRFARNTVDSLTTIRKLKEHGTEVYFEKENIWTLDSKGELLITIMSSLAQEESRSISENTTWGKRKSFADGKASVAYSHFLGYDKDFVINEEEAQTVRLIYKLFLSGLSYCAIGKELKKRGLKTPYGRDSWTTSTIKSILTNEKYKGSALLQKQFTVDFLQKKVKKNEGELTQYYIEDHHPAIIPPATFALVQEEIKKRNVKSRSYSGLNIFCSRIICGECGGLFGSKVWHSTDKYRKIIYQCNQKYTGDKPCSSPHLSEDNLKELFLKALNRLTSEKAEVMANLELLQTEAADTSAIAAERAAAMQEVSTSEEILRAFARENARTARDQDDFNQKYSDMYAAYEQQRAHVKELSAAIDAKEAISSQIRSFCKTFTALDAEQTAFDENLWAGLVDHVTVYAKGRVVFTFIGGIEIEVEN